MPHLRIYGIPTEISQSCLEALADELKEALASMPALGIGKENVFIFYPPDRMLKGLGEEVICDAVLFETPERTLEVRKEFAEKITGTLQRFFPEAIAKCMAFTFDRSLGYSTRDPKTKKGGE